MCRIELRVQIRVTDTELVPSAWMQIKFDLLRGAIWRPASQKGLEFCILRVYEWLLIAIEVSESERDLKPRFLVKAKHFFRAEMVFNYIRRNYAVSIGGKSYQLHESVEDECREKSKREERASVGWQ